MIELYQVKHSPTSTLLSFLVEKLREFENSSHRRRHRCRRGQHRLEAGIQAIVATQHLVAVRLKESPVMEIVIRPGYIPMGSDGTTEKRIIDVHGGNPKISLGAHVTALPVELSLEDWSA